MYFFGKKPRWSFNFKNTKHIQTLSMQQTDRALKSNTYIEHYSSYMHMHANNLHKK